MLLLLVLIYFWTKSVSRATNLDCYEGAYRVKKEPFNDCSGYKACPLGHFCENEIKYPCPGGTYGGSENLMNSSCSGLCNPGFYCPAGSSSPTSNFCGNSSVFCPKGSYTPSPAPDGYYTVDVNGNNDISTIKTRSNILKCPTGYWCRSGVKYPCEGGRYGNKEGLSTSECSGKCPEGWFCPLASSDPFRHPCRSNAREYCPLGSNQSRPTAEGFYAILSHIDEGGGYGAEEICPRGSFCVEGVKYHCPAGRYGARVREHNSSCTGDCIGGYYCPPGSVSAYQVQCDNTNVFCPPGSGTPLPVTPGYYSIGHQEWANRSLSLLEVEVGVEIGGIPFDDRARVGQKMCEPGFFCDASGLKQPCPAGRYGASPGLQTSSCTSYCDAGYYCPKGSCCSRQYPCGGADRFCPPGSAQPQMVESGYYTVGNADPATRSEERKCEPGFYCQEGVKRLCLGGYYGGTYGLTSSNCSGLCAPGFYCPEGSFSSTEVMCGDSDRFCPEGSSVPTWVEPGFYSIGGTDSSQRSDQAIAPLGHYSQHGVLYVCPAGFYGEKEGLRTAQCSGACRVPGFYCPAGSTSPRMRYCGGDHVFCPAGTVAPIHVHAGFYTADYQLEPCPPGQWRNLTIPNKDFTSQLIDATIENEESNTVFGPDAFVSVTARPLTTCQLCPLGTYKRAAGDSYDLCIPCNSTTVSSYEGNSSHASVAVEAESTADRSSCRCTTILSDEAQEEGLVMYFNRSSGLCSPWSRLALRFVDDSPAADWTASSLRITATSGGEGGGSSTREDLAQWYSSPYFNVTYKGSRSNFMPEDYAFTRRAQHPCEPGHFCNETNGQRLLCPAGRYGSLFQETRPTCSGLCAPGYYCLQGSISPFSKPCGGTNYICPEGSDIPLVVPKGYYSHEDVPETRRFVQFVCPPGYFCPGDGLRYKCAAGTYTSQEGTAEPACLGPCEKGYYCLEGSDSKRQYPCGNSTVYCPTGSPSPKIIYPGFYGIHTGVNAGELQLWDQDNATFSVELPCEPGYYCSGGVKQPCPPGTFGWRHGMTDDQCSGPCAPGFYCPSVLLPQSDAPSYTQWPGMPQLTATEFECGVVTSYCPRGTPYPLRVSGGYYSVGGGSNNRTRSAQVVCPRGSYCQNAIPFLCPPGRYGSTEGLLDRSCTAGCPAGFYCPSGTVDPIPCPEGFYSTGQVAVCSECPGASTRTEPLKCKFEKGCCFR